MSVRLTMLATLLIVLSGQSAPTETTPTTQPEALPLLRQVPQSVEDIDTRLELARTRMEALAPATQPATQPTDPAEIAALDTDLARYKAWETYAGRLRHAATTLTRLAEIRDEQQIQAITDEIAELQREAKSLRQLPVPIEVTDEDVTPLQTQLQELQTRINIITDDQAQRAALIATGFDEQRQRLDGELKTLRQQYDDLLKRRDADGVPTTAPAEPTESRSERLLLDVRIATAELMLQTVAWERQLTELIAAREERRLAALRTKLEALQKHLTAMVAAQGRDRIATLRNRQAAATQPVDRAMLDIELLVERVLLAYFRGPGGTDAARDTDKISAERLGERIALSRGYWDRAGTLLQFRTGEEALLLQWQLAEEVDTLSDQLTDLRARHTELLTRLRRLQRIRERVLRRFAELADDVRRQVPARQTADQTRIEARLNQLRSDLTEAMRGRIETIEQRAGQIDTVLANGREHITWLHDLERNLDWQRITRRDAGLLRTDWREAGLEFAALGRAITGAPPPVTAGRDVDLEAELFGTQADADAQMRSIFDAAATTFSRITPGGWLRAALAVAGAIVVGLVITFISRRTSVPLARGIEAEYAQAVAEGTNLTAGLSARINLLGWNLTGDLAAPLLVALALTLLLEAAGNVDPLTAMLHAGIWLIAGAVALLRFVHHLFEADSPPHRPLPCNDDVARHYRWWLSALILFALFVLLVPLMLLVGDAAWALQAAGFEIFKTGSLLLLLVFLFRKRQVLGLLGGVAGAWAQTLASILYPIVFLVLLGLLGFQIIGYGALVSYVGQGIGMSFVALLLAAAVSQYLVDLIERYWRWQARGVAALVAPAPVGDHETQRQAESRSHYVLFMTKSLVRLAALIAVLTGVFWVWNLPLPHEWVSSRALGLGALVILIALIADRVIFAALFALQRSGRLPESTSGLIHRWLRGVLTVLVVLTLVAIGGWQIESVWTFLTTLLAMVAIGFVAVWSILSNVLATLVILIWRPFNVGEEIEISPENLGGRVVDISFMYTILRSEDGVRTSVPNNMFAQKFIKRKPSGGIPTRTLAEQLERETPLGEEEGTPGRDVGTEGRRDAGT